MTSWVLTGNGNGILCPDSGDLGKNTVLDTALDLLDFLESLLFIQTINEKIDIACRSQLLMIVFSETSLGCSIL